MNWNRSLASAVFCLQLCLSQIDTFEAGCERNTPHPVVCPLHLVFRGILLLGCEVPFNHKDYVFVLMPLNYNYKTFIGIQPLYYA